MENCTPERSPYWIFARRHTTHVGGLNLFGLLSLSISDTFNPRKSEIAISFPISRLKFILPRRLIGVPVKGIPVKIPRFLLLIYRIDFLCGTDFVGVERTQNSSIWNKKFSWRKIFLTDKTKISFSCLFFFAEF